MREKQSKGRPLAKRGNRRMPGDYDNKQAMKEAFRDGDTLLLISGDARLSLELSSTIAT
jgi:hypothetical protein